MTLSTARWVNRVSWVTGQNMLKLKHVAKCYMSKHRGSGWCDPQAFFDSYKIFRNYCVGNYYKTIVQ